MNDDSWKTCERCEERIIMSQGFTYHNESRNFEECEVYVQVQGQDDTKPFSLSPIDIVTNRFRKNYTYMRAHRATGARTASQSGAKQIQRRSGCLWE